MKKIKIIILFLIAKWNVGIAAYPSQDSTRMDSIYHKLVNTDLNQYIGQSVKKLLLGIETPNYSLGHIEDPILYLNRLEISYKNSDAMLLIYFDCMEFVPRYCKDLDRDEWKNINSRIIYEKISKIILVNYKVKLYPQYIKKSG